MTIYFYTILSMPYQVMLISEDSGGIYFSFDKQFIYLDSTLGGKNILH